MAASNFLLTQKIQILKNIDMKVKLGVEFLFLPMKKVTGLDNSIKIKNHIILFDSSWFGSDVKYQNSINLLDLVFFHDNYILFGPRFGHIKFMTGSINNVLSRF